MSLDRTTPLVVDASAFIEYLLGTDLGLAVATIIDGTDIELHTPAICDIEVCSGFRRIVRTTAATAERVSSAISAFMDLPLSRHGHQRLLHRIFELRENFTASDGAYIALCEALGGTLVTCDARMTRALQALLPLNVIGVAD